MNSFRIIAVLLYTTLAADIYGAPEESERAEFFRLLAEVPRQGTLHYYVQLVQNPETAESKEELETARKEIAKAKEVLPKLRKFIKVGASVLDYPGLLARGRLSYGGLPSPQIAELKPEYRASDTYVIYIGAPPNSEGIADTDFEIIFDRTRLNHRGQQSGLVTLTPNDHPGQPSAAAPNRLRGHGTRGRLPPPLLRCAHPSGAACGWLSRCARFHPLAGAAPAPPVAELGVV